MVINVSIFLFLFYIDIYNFIFLNYTTIIYAYRSRDLLIENYKNIPVITLFGNKNKNKYSDPGGYIDKGEDTRRNCM